ncbi:hypothetical protein FRB98_001823, partial [Tulasnella sp. 332]
ARRRGRQRSRSSSSNRGRVSLRPSKSPDGHAPDIFDQFLPDAWRNDVGRRIDYEQRPSRPRQRSASGSLFGDDDEADQAPRASHLSRRSSPSPERPLPPSRRRARATSPGDDFTSIATDTDATATKKRKTTTARKQQEMLVGHYLLEDALNQPEPSAEEEVPERPIAVKARLGFGQGDPETGPPGAEHGSRPSRTNHSKRPSVLTHDKDAGGLVQRNYSLNARPRISNSPFKKKPGLEKHEAWGDHQGLNAGFEDWQGPAVVVEGVQAALSATLVQKLPDASGVKADDDDLSDYVEEEEPARPPAEPAEDEDEGTASGEDSPFGVVQGPLAIPDYRRWKPPPPQVYVPEPVSRPAIRPTSLTPLQERKAFIVDIVLPQEFSAATLPPGGLEEDAVSRVQFTAFSEVWDASRELNDVLRGVERLHFRDRDISFTDDTYADANLREAWKAGSGMSAQVTALDGRGSADCRRTLSSAARCMAAAGKYAMHETAVPGVGLVLFPSTDIHMCEMLLVPESLKGILETLIIGRLVLPRRLRN